MRRYTLNISDREFVVDVQEIDADNFEVVVGGDTYQVSLASDENLAETTITPGFRAQPRRPPRPASRPPASSRGGASRPFGPGRGIVGPGPQAGRRWRQGHAERPDAGRHPRGQRQAGRRRHPRPASRHPRRNEDAQRDRRRTGRPSPKSM
jgi:hypothetical protein